MSWKAIRNSSIKLILTRHEQGAAFMAATYGRLTGKPGVCITTLGPGALNLTTGAAYALLGAMPMIMLTGQKGIMSSRQANSRSSTWSLFQAADQAFAPDRQHQAASRPWFATPSGSPWKSGRVRSTGTARGHRRRRSAKPSRWWRSIRSKFRSRIAAALDRAADMILKAKRPLIMLGAAASRPRSTAGIGGFVRRTQIPFFTTQMGKGTVPGGTTSTWARPRSANATTFTRPSIAPT